MEQGTGHPPAVSICIPVYYSGPDTPRVLDELLTSIEAQDYPKWRTHVILSIQSCKLGPFLDLAEVIHKDIPKDFQKRFLHVICQSKDIQGPAMNTHAAMEMALRGGYIKIMNQDDFFDSTTALTEMVETLEKSESKWLVNACIHTDGLGKKRERPHIPQ